MKVKFSLLLLITCLTLSVYAQDQIEALKFSQNILQSDASSLGAGNAYNALGANFISTEINPAGLALYRKSEISFGVDLSTLSVQSSYLGTSEQAHNINLNIPSLSFVFTKIRKEDGVPVKDGWTSVSFGFGVVRTNSFQSNTTFQGTNTNNSILNSYAQEANGIPQSTFTDMGNSPTSIAGMAYWSYLINPEANTTQNKSYLPANTGEKPNLLQQNNLNTTGSAYDVNFALAASYANKVYIGACISIPVLNYHESVEFNETNLNANPLNYFSSTFSQNVDISGAGVKASAGIVYKPFQFLRIGVSIQSPTFYDLHATYSQSMSGVTDTGTYSVSSPNSEMNFNLVTPYRVNAGLALIAGKYGHISVDCEYLNYSSAYYSSSSYSYTNQNDTIQKGYTSAFNVNVGAELRFLIFALRGGYGIYGSPYKYTSNLQGADGSAKVYSFGVGIREKVFFFDIGYQHISSSEYIQPYSLTSQQVLGATSNLTRSTLMASLGFRF